MWRTTATTRSRNEERSCNNFEGGAFIASSLNGWILGIITKQMNGNSFVWLASGFGGEGRCQDEALLTASTTRGHEEILPGDFIRCRIEIRPTPAGSSHRYPELGFVLDFYREERPFGWQFGGCSDNGQAKIICPLKFFSMLHRTVRGKYGIYGNELLREVHDFDHLADDSRYIERAVVQRTRILGLKGDSGWFISEVLSRINPQRSIGNPSSMEELTSGMNFASNHRNDLLLDPADPPSSEDRGIQSPVLPTFPAEVLAARPILTPTHVAPPEPEPSPVNAKTGSNSTEYVVTKGFVVKTWGAFHIVWTPEHLAILRPNDLHYHNDVVALGAFVCCTIAKLAESILDKRMEYCWHVIHWEPHDDTSIENCRAVIEGERALVCAEMAFTGYRRADMVITNQNRQSINSANRVAHYSHSFFKTIVDRDGKIEEPAPGCTYWVVLKAVPIDEWRVQWVIARETFPLTSSEDTLVASPARPFIPQRRASSKQSTDAVISYKASLNDLTSIVSTQSTGSTMIHSGRVVALLSDFVETTAVQFSGDSETRCCGAREPKEPKCEIDIRNFVNDRFKFEPDLYAKVDVNGDAADPLWKFLKKEKGGTLFDRIKWNFTKFLVDREGNVVKRYGPTTGPKEMVMDIEKVLAGRKVCC